MKNETAVLAENDPLLEELVRSLERPRRLGRYELLEPVGEGAIGRVYRAFDPVTGRDVAVKAFRPQPTLLAEIGDCRRRFHHEAQAAGGLSHPHIVVIYDVSDDYFVMEFLHGLTLRKLLDQRGRLPLEEALPILEGVAQALDHAHSHGIVHRDIKPSNIMVLPDGQAKVMDFGTALFEALPVTAAGQTIRSPFYMAPEQIDGARVTGQADVFAMAAVAYEVLTGRRAFDGPNVPTVAARVLTQEPEPPSRVVPGLPERCDAALARGLHKRPGARYATAQELVNELRGGPAPRVRRVLPAPPRRTARSAQGAETQDLRLVPEPAAPMLVHARHLRPLGGLLILAMPILASTWSALAPARATPPPARARAPLSVLSHPEGAIVWIDGKPAGRTPLRVDHLRPGTHRVKVLREGYTPAELQLAVREGDEEPLVFHLQAAAPRLAAARVPPAARRRPDAPPLREGDMVELGPDVAAPKRVVHRSPSYPWHAYPAEGLVRLEVTITENGEPTDIRVVQAPAAPLADALIEAVRNWRYDPARKDGVRVRVRWPVEMKFTVRRT